MVAKSKTTAKSKATAKPELKSRTRVGRNGWTYSDPSIPMGLQVLMDDIEKGVCGDPRLCVVAQAILRQLSAVCGGGLQVVVCARITKIWIYATMTKVRYATPTVLANALREFDRTRIWNLDPGVYQLKPLSDSYLRANRWDKKKTPVAGKKGVQSKSETLWVATTRKDESTRAAPTRRTFIEPPDHGELKSLKKTSPKKKATTKKKASPKKKTTNAK